MCSLIECCCNVFQIRKTYNVRDIVRIYTRLQTSIMFNKYETQFIHRSRALCLAIKPIVCSCALCTMCERRRILQKKGANIVV